MQGQGFGGDGQDPVRHAVAADQQVPQVPRHWAIHVHGMRGAWHARPARHAKPAVAAAASLRALFLPLNFDL